MTLISTVVARRPSGHSATQSNLPTKQGQTASIIDDIAKQTLVFVLQPASLIFSDLASSFSSCRITRIGECRGFDRGGTNRKEWVHNNINLFGSSRACPRYSKSSQGPSPTRHVHFRQRITSAFRDQEARLCMSGLVVIIGRLTL